MWTLKNERMKKAKLAAVVVLSILAVVIVLQNTEVTQTRILFMTVQMSRALLLILTFALGFVTGILGTSFSMRKKTSKK
jgi:uncharacterized integral membrane protein